MCIYIYIYIDNNDDNHDNNNNDMCIYVYIFTQYTKGSPINPPASQAVTQPLAHAQAKDNVI